LVAARSTHVQGQQADGGTRLNPGRIPQYPIPHGLPIHPAKLIPQRVHQRAGGGWKRIELDMSEIAAPVKPDEALALDEALARFEKLNPLAAHLMKLRYFVGLKHREAAGVLGISPRTANKLWRYARSWLLAEIRRE
jgi:hypothetical protein